MINKCLILIMLIISQWAGAQDFFYCSQNHGYIQLGMTTQQVINACGTPISKEKSNQLFTRKVPVIQLIFNSQGSPQAFYGVYSLPVGNDTGVKLRIDIINNKIASIQLDGSSSNAVSVCNDHMLQIGDSISQVYAYCGNPTLINNTYVYKTIESEHNPEIWTYKIDAYQAPMRLTFVNGQLQSMD